MFYALLRSLDEKAPFFNINSSSFLLHNLFIFYLASFQVCLLLNSIIFCMNIVQKNETLNVLTLHYVYVLPRYVFVVRIQCPWP